MQVLSVMTIKSLVSSGIAFGGIVGGVVAAVWQSADGIGATEVLIALNVLVLGAVYQLGREVSTIRGEIKTKASKADVFQAIADCPLNASHRGGKDAA